MDDKIYELMAQAEVLQEHALALQNKASESISEIPEAFAQMKRKLLSTTIQSVFICVILGTVIISAAWFLMEWTTERLRDEKTALKWEIADLKGQIGNLRKEVNAEEKRLAKVQTWGVELVNNKGKRLLKLGKGDQFGEIWKLTDGRVGIEIIRKK